MRQDKLYYLQNSCDESLLLQGTNNSDQIERVCFHLEWDIEKSEKNVKLKEGQNKNYFAVLVSRSLKL